MGLRPTQGDEKRLLFSGTAIPPPCHPDRSAAQWRDLRFGGSFLEMFFDSAVYRSLSDRRRVGHP
jgi:hypothetical protein